MTCGEGKDEMKKGGTEERERQEEEEEKKRTQKQNGVNELSEVEGRGERINSVRKMNHHEVL